jgi:haloalkane dehalogenase
VLPIAGEPADVYATMERAHAALAAATYPKLLFAGEPGALVPTAVAEDFGRRLHNCRLVRLGSGLHYLQEDHPDVIAREVVAFIAEVEARMKGGAAMGKGTRSSAGNG